MMADQTIVRVTIDDARGDRERLPRGREREGESERDNGKNFDGRAEFPPSPELPDWDNLQRI